MNILIIGASGDIGSEIAKTLSFKHKLILVGNKNVISMKKLSIELGNSCIYTDCIDISNSNEVETFFNKLNNYNIEINALIFAAGISHIGLLQDMTIKEWDKIIAINLSSAFYIVRKCLPQMISKKFGKIIFISSIWGKVGASMEVAYSASKSGLDGLAKALAQEVAPSNISVNSINLGMVNTKMNSLISLEDVAIIEDEIPYGRQASTMECAMFVEQVLDSPNYLTGQNIGFDGGWH